MENETPNITVAKNPKAIQMRHSDPDNLQEVVTKLTLANQSLREDNQDLSKQNQAYLATITELQNRLTAIEAKSGEPSSHGPIQEVLPTVSRSESECGTTPVGFAAYPNESTQNGSNGRAAETSVSTSNTTIAELHKTIDDLQHHITKLIQEKIDLQMTIETLDHRLSTFIVPNTEIQNQNGVCVTPKTQDIPSNVCHEEDSAGKKAASGWFSGLLSSKSNDLATSHTSVPFSNVPLPTLEVAKGNGNNTPPKKTQTNTLGSTRVAEHSEGTKKDGSYISGRIGNLLSHRRRNSQGVVSGGGASSPASTSPVANAHPPNDKAPVACQEKQIAIDSTECIVSTEVDPPSETSIEGVPLSLITELPRKNENDRDFWERMKQNDVSEMFDVVLQPRSISADGIYSDPWASPHSDTTEQTKLQQNVMDTKKSRSSLWSGRFSTVVTESMQ